MSPDLEGLIALQQIDSSMREAQRRLADEPARRQQFEDRLDAARSAVATAKDQLAANQSARREIEKELALHQGRLSKFRDQAMAVKTNQEYHAVQHEIAFAQKEIGALEDRVLGQMMEADEITAALKIAEAALLAEQAAVENEKRALTSEHAELERLAAQLSDERAAHVARVAPETLAIYEAVARRRGAIVMAEAREGICTICHVRLRPQVFNTVRRNEAVLQCESCNRILYFDAAATTGGGAGASS
ncbi:MAG: zinc ribbon domain-containing protein [Vicinamibacterales bacterium]